MSAEEIAVSPPPVAPRAPGRYLSLVGLTPDGRRLRLADVAGNEFTVDIDARLRAALGGSSPAQAGSGRDTSAPVETKMDSMLRPRDIQARIRSGETPETVAAAAGTSVEKVMPFAAPVLAEREHVAQRAQRSSIRRPAGSSAEGPRALGDAVTSHLHGRNVDPEQVTWDAWRREDGRWALTGRYSIQGRDGLAELTFDQPGNFVVLDNDDARWLVGELPDPAPVAEPDPEPVRRLSAVREHAPEPELGDDVLGLSDPISEADQPLEAFLDGPEQLEIDVTQVEVDVEVIEEVDAPVVEAEEPGEPEAEDEQPARRPVKKSRGRASVPSWDEIMFGGGPGESPSR
jgi:hypothetical protein